MGIVTEREVAGSTHTRATAISHLEQLVLGSYSQWDHGTGTTRPTKTTSVADWRDGVSASCTVGPTVLNIFII